MDRSRSTTPTSLRRDLLRWYDLHHRKLPWRTAPPTAAPPDPSAIRHAASALPYHVLVSETMLQQTQVATVIPYFQRFIAAFPTPADLAAADEQKVLRLWQGLGYYRRARNLHAAAKMIAERFGGQVPSAVEDLLHLPGVGRYTAGAVASIAFQTRAPIVDGNVARVLSRWFELDEPVSDPRVRSRLWQLAEQVIDDTRPGDFNQAMMELGALVCSPRGPKCLLCPVASHCGAHRAGRADELPVIAPRKPRQPVTHLILALRKPDGRYLFERRPQRGLWSNMWQLVTAEGTIENVMEWARGRYGLTITTPQPAGQFLHVTTHRDITFTVMRSEVTAGRLRHGAGLWRRLKNVNDLPLAKPQQRAIALLEDQGNHEDTTARRRRERKKDRMAG